MSKLPGVLGVPGPALSRLAVNGLVNSDWRERRGIHTYGYSRRAGLQIKPSINPVGEAHRTSGHLAHSFLFGDFGCTLSEVAYGRILAREVVVQAGNHPSVLGGSLSDPYRHSRQRDVHNTQRGVQMKKEWDQRVTSKPAAEGSRCHSLYHFGSYPQECVANSSHSKYQARGQSLLSAS